MYLLNHPLEPAPRQTDRIHDRRLVDIVLAVLSIVTGLAVARILTLLDRYSHYDGLLRVFFTALLFSTLLTGLTVMLLRWLDRRDPLPKEVYAGLLFWGAVLSTGLALPLNQRILRAVDDWVERKNWIPYAGENRGFLLGAPIAGPIVEESLKAIGLLLVFYFFRSLFRSPRDGFIMGALVGAGFNWFESALYVANDFGQWGVHTYGMELGARYGLFGFAGHALFTGLIGLGLGYAAVAKTRIRAILWGVTGFILGLFAHLVNNALGIAVIIILHTLDQPIPDLGGPPSESAFISSWLGATIRSFVIFLPSVLLILYTLRRTGKWEQNTIRAQLANEPSGIVTDQEREQMEKETSWRTRKYKWEPKKQSKAIIEEQNRLAFLKYQVEREGGDPLSSSEVESQRSRITALRGESRMNST